MKKRMNVDKHGNINADSLLKIQQMSSQMTDEGSSKSLREKAREAIAAKKMARAGKHTKRTVVDKRNEELESEEADIKSSIAEKASSQERQKLLLQGALDTIERSSGAITTATYSSVLSKKDPTQLDLLIKALYERQNGLDKEIDMDDWD